MTQTLPHACGIALKEWAGVRDALASGRQTILLRKGGIHEGPRGFLPEYAQFWIYPTHVHEQEQGLTTTSKPYIGPTLTDHVLLSTFVQNERVARLETLAELDALADLHVWTEETTHKRFHYRHPGLWLVVARVFTCATPWTVEVTPAHAGCKSWVPLESSLPTSGLTAVLDDRAFASALADIEELLPEGRLSPLTDPDQQPEAG